MTTITDVLQKIDIVMVNTTLPANIGAALRAMKTMGLSQLTLVQPKHFPHPDINALAAGAADLIPHIRIVDTLEQAIADCHLVFATSARSRSIPFPLLTAAPACREAIRHAVQGYRIAMIFGREDRGLTNDELALANYHLTIPVNPEYGVLNVAQAIQIVCYELRMAASALDHPDETAPHNPMPVVPYQSMEWDEPLVTQQQMQQFHQHLQQMLVEIDFLDQNNPRLLPLRLRRLFGRIHLDRMEYNLLRGVFTRVQALAEGTWQADKKRSQGEQTDV